jgi:cyanophycinase
VFERLHHLYACGGTIAGTSAGASVMTETMLVAGDGDSSAHRNGVQMAPGFGLLPGALVDQHFAERGRIGRLVGAVAQNPRILGIGIDENTAVIMRRRRFHVLGDGAVYVVDGSTIAYSNLEEEEVAEKQALSIHGVTLHVLSDGDSFDLATRTAKAGKTDDPPKDDEDKKDAGNP